MGLRRVAGVLSVLVFVIMRGGILPIIPMTNVYKCMTEVPRHSHPDWSQSFILGILHGPHDSALLYEKRWRFTEKGTEIGVSRWKYVCSDSPLHLLGD